MAGRFSRRGVMDEAGRARRRRYFHATLVTCAAVLMVGSAIHVVGLGHKRVFGEMRSKASYDLSQEAQKIRAAGEDVTLHERHEANRLAGKPYTMAEAEALLPPEKWAEIDTMILIPAGQFMMGSDSLQTAAQNRPQHKVDLPAFRMDKYLVTNAQYARFVAAKHYRAPLDWTDGRIPAGKELYPVTMVSWYDAHNYCVSVGKRLPKEAEWEKAARGTDGRRWPWGERMDATRLNTYYTVGSATEVTRYPQGASPYGVMDMAGNVSQWIGEDFMPYPGSDAPAELFQGKIAVASTPADRAMKVVDLVGVDAKYKVLRGGSWKSDPFSTATYHRNFSWPHYASDFFGFRCAGDVEVGKGKP